MTGKNIISYGKRALPLAFILLCFCAESDEIIRQKLDIILKDDLEAIIGPDTTIVVSDDPNAAPDTVIKTIRPESLLENPYFELLEYRIYDEGAYSRMAIADFYFSRTISVKIRRKYRYHRRMGMWDRYYNKYYTIAPEINEKEN